MYIYMVLTWFDGTLRILKFLNLLLNRRTTTGTKRHVCGGEIRPWCDGQPWTKMEIWMEWPAHIWILESSESFMKVIYIYTHTHFHLRMKEGKLQSAKGAGHTSKLTKLLHEQYIYIYIESYTHTHTHIYIYIYNTERERELYRYIYIDR